MSSLTYGVTEEFHRIGSNVRISYGIAVYADAETNGTNTIIASVYDVSTDRLPLDRLVQWCNLLELSPTHLREVIDDFLAT
ncbi:MAG: hypothetical protein IJW49_11150 [Clostridia bacterium]|nr:hypothetical protein [Clostridia bacterium]